MPPVNLLPSFSVDLLEQYFKHHLSQFTAGSERLGLTMAYSLIPLGKALRSRIVQDLAYAGGINYEASLPLACATEALHTYSLIHDDLPCMDNSDLRRSRPAAHKQFDEATALLAGNALLSWSFSQISELSTLPSQHREALYHSLSLLSGHLGLMAGQSNDLESAYITERACQFHNLELLQTQVLTTYYQKTALFFEWACYAGALLAHTSPQVQVQLQSFGVLFGIAFQLYDDLKDLDPKLSEQEGKPAHQDASKGTYVQLYGYPHTQTLIIDLLSQVYFLLQSRELDAFSHNLISLLQTAFPQELLDLSCNTPKPLCWNPKILPESSLYFKPLFTPFTEQSLLSLTAHFVKESS